MFTKLKDAYVKARYSKHYRISLEELDWLSKVMVAVRVLHASSEGQLVNSSGPQKCQSN